jgi:hypothetical protein
MGDFLTFIAPKALLWIGFVVSMVLTGLLVALAAWAVEDQRAIGTPFVG